MACSPLPHHGFVELPVVNRVEKPQIITSAQNLVVQFMPELRCNPRRY